MSDQDITSPTVNTDDILIVGAGPAGLTAGLCLCENSSFRVRILEASPLYLGGISRTEVYKGFHFDIGGHRFFTKSQEIEALWHSLLPKDFMLRPRLSRIFYRNKFYSYPLRPFEALHNLGVFESLVCLFSYLRAHLFPTRNPKTFSQWVSNAFGRRLFTIFFKTYTEKVWGMSTNELSSDWAAQRIKGLSLGRAVFSGLLKKSKTKAKIKSLTETFHYPRLGPGMLWQAAAEKIKANGGILDLGRKVTTYNWLPSLELWKVTSVDTDGKTHVNLARHVVCSAPMRETIPAIYPPMESATQALDLRYRDFITVILILNRPVPFNDNWIYVHDPSVQVGRIQNFAAWSQDMVPDSSKGCLGMEYFCFENDGFWEMPDNKIIGIAKTELEKLGLFMKSDVCDGCVVRQPKAYPVYDDQYTKIVESVRHEILKAHPTFHLVGRNGLHKYDNQDHAMMTGLLTARNIISGKRLYDPWSVNEDSEYHEEKQSTQAAA